MHRRALKRGSVQISQSTVPTGPEEIPIRTLLPYVVFQNRIHVHTSYTVRNTILKMEASCISETSAILPTVTWCNNLRMELTSPIKHCNYHELLLFLLGSLPQVFSFKYVFMLNIADTCISAGTSFLLTDSISVSTLGWWIGCNVKHFPIISHLSSLVFLIIGQLFQVHLELLEPQRSTLPLPLLYSWYPIKFQDESQPSFEPTTSVLDLSNTGHALNRIITVTSKIIIIIIHSTVLNFSGWNLAGIYRLYFHGIKRFKTARTRARNCVWSSIS